MTTARAGALGLALAVTIAGAGCDTATAKSPQAAQDPELPADVAAGASDDLADDPPPPPEPTADETAPHPHVPRSADWACDLLTRLAACDAPLLHDGAPAPTDPADLLYHVNREHGLPPDWPGADHDLVHVPARYATRSVRLRQVAWHSPTPSDLSTTSDGRPVGHDGMVGFRALFDAAAEQGIALYIASGYRSYATQAAIYAAHVDDELRAGLDPDDAHLAASTYSAHPGHSEHQLGTTADLVYQSDDGTISRFGQDTAFEMASSPQMQWVIDNAHRFGVVMTYGHDKVATTQYVWEPWHWRFVGVEAADAMRRCDLNTEELLAARYGLGPATPFAGESFILFDALAPGPDDHDVQVVPAGQPFTVTLTLANIGSTNWFGYELRPTTSPAFGGAAAAVPCTPRFQAAAVELQLVAPTVPGLYQSEWWLFDADGRDVAGPLLVPVFVPGPPTAAASEATAP